MPTGLCKARGPHHSISKAGKTESGLLCLSLSQAPLNLPMQLPEGTQQVQHEGGVEVFLSLPQLASKAGTDGPMSALERDAVCLSRLLCAEEEPALLFTGHREVKPAGSEEWPNHLTWGWRAPAPGKAHSQCVWLTSRGKQNRAIAGPPRHRPGLAADNTSGK